MIHCRTIKPLELSVHVHRPSVMFKIKIILLACMLSNTFAYYTYNIQVTPQSSLTLLTLNDIIHNHLKPCYKNVIFYLQATNEQASHEQNDAVNWISAQLNESRTMRIDTAQQNVATIKTNEKSILNIIIVDGMESLQAVFTYIGRIRLECQSSLTFAIIPSGPVAHQHVIMRHIFETAWSMYLCKIVVLAGCTNQLQPIFTYYPYTPSQCDSTEPVCIAVYNRRTGLSAASKLYPKKYRNMYRCPLHIASYNFYPYSYFRRSVKDQSILRLGGIEGNILRSLARRMNFTRVLFDCTQNGMYARGCLEMLFRGAVNLTLGNLGYTAERQHMFSATKPIYVSSYSLAVPPGQPYGSIAKLRLPFSMHVWFLVWAVSGLAVTTVSLVDWLGPIELRRLIFGHDRYPLHTTTAITLGVSVKQVPKRNFARFMFGSWILLVFVVRNSYQGILCYMMMRTQLNRRPNTLTGILEQNYTIYSDRGALQFVEDVFARNKIPIHILDDQWSAIQSLCHEIKNVAYILNTAVIEAFNKKYQYEGDGIEVPQERLMISPTVIYVKSSILQQINIHIQLMASSGLLDYWFKCYCQGSKFKIARIPLNKIDIVHLSGLYFLWLLLIIASVFAVLLELLVHRMHLIYQKYWQ